MALVKIACLILACMIFAVWVVGTVLLTAYLVSSTVHGGVTTRDVIKLAIKASAWPLRIPRDLF